MIRIDGESSETATDMLVDMLGTRFPYIFCFCLMSYSLFHFRWVCFPQLFFYYMA